MCHPLIWWLAFCPCDASSMYDGSPVCVCKIKKECINICLCDWSNNDSKIWLNVNLHLKVHKQNMITFNRAVQQSRIKGAIQLYLSKFGLLVIIKFSQTSLWFINMLNKEVCTIIHRSLHKGCLEETANGKNIVMLLF